ncbi:MAG: DUF4225 domain-containing protein, partial [Pseudomonas fluorescens]
SCDIHDVTKAASDLVATGCNIGMTHLPDGVTRLRFSSVISAYANEVVQAVDEGLISAWEGVQEIISEYEELSSKARFYLQNGIGVVAGVMQIRTGVAATAAPAAIGAIPGTLLIAHGTNNIYEGLGNIYNGPEAPATIDLSDISIKQHLKILAQVMSPIILLIYFYLDMGCSDQYKSRAHSNCSSVIL